MAGVQFTVALPSSTEATDSPELPCDNDDATELPYLAPLLVRSVGCNCTEPSQLLGCEQATTKVVNSSWLAGADTTSVEAAIANRQGSKIAKPDTQSPGCRPTMPHLSARMMRIGGPWSVWTILYTYFRHLMPESSWDGFGEG